MEVKQMTLQNAEHLTRYTVFYDGVQYIRLVEEPIKGTPVISWLTVIQDSVHLIREEDNDKLEEEFAKLIQ